MVVTPHGTDFTTWAPVFTAPVTFVLLAWCTASCCGSLCFYGCEECTGVEHFACVSKHFFLSGAIMKNHASS
jgi:hypothetical protein